MSNSVEAVWKRPAWITAIVGLASVFLTVPDIIGNYLTKQQDIELAREKTEGVRLGNIESKQDQEFKIVNSTLAQQGTERVFVLRYLASTLDDPDAKNWAEAEVKRLDELASTQEELAEFQKKLEEKERELESFVNKEDAVVKKTKDDIVVLQAELSKKNSEVIELRQKAGIADRNEIRRLISVEVKLDWGANVKIDRIGISVHSRDSSAAFSCRRPEVFCLFGWDEVPETITIEKRSLFSSLTAVEIHRTCPTCPLLSGRIIPFACLADKQKMVCRPAKSLKF